MSIHNFFVFLDNSFHCTLTSLIVNLTQSNKRCIGAAVLLSLFKKLNFSTSLYLYWKLLKMPKK